MRAHVIENGIVVNTIIVESLSVLPNLVSAENGGDIGWRYDGTSYVAPDPLPEPEPAPAPTKEQLMAQLTALSAQIQALE
jgi:hypothetical protein